MIFHLGEGSYDITFICVTLVGVILLVIYILFAYRVTHKGDFYQIRRWKASIWLASILTVSMYILLGTFLITLIVINASEKNVYEIIRLMVVGFFTTLIFSIPFQFIISIGTHYKIKWWLDSDDYLDKIWKDPNTGHKSPIREI
jgi:cation transport ATPase